MIRYLCAAALTSAAFSTVGASSAQAYCPPPLIINTALVGTAVCYSFVGDCIDANVYYRVVGISGNTSSLYPPICPR